MRWWVIAAVLAIAGPALADDMKLNPDLPDPRVTPGLVDTSITQDNIDTTICVPNYTSQKGVRNVTEAMKKLVFIEYHITHPLPSEFDIDHLIPLELGGANGDSEHLGNLWPHVVAP